jgi:6-pyruvoyltetrahydropterin/6-carboxytetrahydropterin synthase
LLDKTQRRAAFVFIQQSTIKIQQSEIGNRKSEIFMKAHLTRRYRFSASHRLHSAEMSSEENLSTYGKCNNPHGHGHNYALEVTVSGTVDPTTGMVCNLNDLDDFMEREVLSRYDLENLNTLNEFAQLVPTTENLCIAIFEILQRGFRHAHLDKVRIEETMLNSFEYAGTDRMRPTAGSSPELRSGEE